MPKLEHVKQLIEENYSISVATIHSLQQHDLDWRGIYRLDDNTSRAWVARLVQRQAGTPWLQQPATVLRWLAANAYAAPELLQTITGETVGSSAQWWMLLTSYVDGQEVEPTPHALRMLALSVAQLHRIPVVVPSQLPRSWWDCETTISTTQRQLAVAFGRTPSTFKPFIRGLLHTVERLQRCAEFPTTLIHGDCWHGNAIQTPDNVVVLIDWDCAGLGLPVLDLGYMLLTCHYEFSSPFVVELNEQRIAAIMQGYQVQRQLTELEQTILADAVRFSLAFHAGRYLEQADQVSSEDSFLKKLQARFDITEQLAQIAIRYTS